MGEKDKKGGRAMVIGQCIEQLTSVLENSQLQTTEDEDVVFQYGSLSIDSAQNLEHYTSDNVFNALPKPFSFDVKVYESQAQFLQSNKALSLLVEKTTSRSKTTISNWAVCCNAVFAEVRTLADVLMY